MAAKSATIIRKALSIYNATAVVVCVPVYQVLEETSAINVCLVSTTSAAQAVLVCSDSLGILVN